ncbi:MAG: type II secretion system protein [Phycisphaerae bacterium]
MTQATRQPGRGGLRRTGFTLIELLVVIAIIGMLAGILVPTIGGILSLGYHAKTESHIKALANGADQYFDEYGAYPGQADWGNWQADTASQHLVHLLFTPKGGKTYGSGWEPRDAFVSPSEDLLDNKDGSRSGTGKGYVPLDGFPKPMAIAYWPADPGKKGKADQFRQSQNDALLTEKDGKLESMISNDTTGLPHMDGKYILLGAGIDRTFFTTDDVTNFRKD